MEGRMFPKALLTVCFVLGLLVLLTVGISADESDARYEAFYAAMREGILSGSTEISVESVGIHQGEIASFFTAFVAENPEYAFCVNRSYRYSYSSTTGQVKQLQITYDDATTVTERKAWIESEIDRISGEIDPAWDELYKLLWINNYICDHYRYELEETEYHDVYNFLLYKEGVCEAYTALFTLLAREAGFEVSFCQSEALNHIWNLVKVDGAWYHVDTTWNDHYSARYEYFLLSDTANTETRAAEYGAVDTFSRYTADRTTYDDAFWRDGIYCAIALTDAGYYCIEGQTVYLVDLEALTATTVTQMESYQWRVPGRPNSIYLDTYHDALGEGNVLIYSTPTSVYAWSMETGALETVYESSHEYEIYGLAKDGRDLIIVHYNPETETEYRETVAGYFDASVCTVVFVSEGTEYEKSRVAFGSFVTLPSVAPQKASDTYYDYVFDGWEGYTDGMTANASRLTFVATYRAILREYTVSFFDGSTLLRSDSYPAGTAFADVRLPAVQPETFVGEVKYRFVGWDVTPTEIVADLTLTAVYEEVPFHTVTYYNGEELFFTERVEEGTPFAPISEVPEKAPTETHSFAFDFWVGFAVGVPVTSDVVLYAQFTAVPLDGETEERQETEETEEVEESQDGEETEDTQDSNETESFPTTEEEPTQEVLDEPSGKDALPETALYLALAAGGLLMVGLLAAVITKIRR